MASQTCRAVMVELALHNPRAAALGCRGESEMVLTKCVLSAQPEQSLLINDRYSGSPALLVDFAALRESIGKVLDAESRDRRCHAARRRIG